MKRFFVIHDEAQDFGLRAPEFNNRETAIAARDEWNHDFPGHRVLEIDEVDTDNAPVVGRERSERTHQQEVRQ